MTRPGWTRGSRGHEALAAASARQEMRALWAVTPEMERGWRDAAAAFAVTGLGPATSDSYRRLMRRVEDQTRRLAIRHSYFVGDGGGSEPPTTVTSAGDDDGHVHVTLRADTSRFIAAIDGSRDKVSQLGFETELSAVTTSVDERIDIRKAAIELAKLGVTSDSVARLIANGHRWESRRSYEVRTIVDRMRAAADHTLEQFGERLIREIEEGQ